MTRRPLKTDGLLGVLCVSEVDRTAEFEQMRSALVRMAADARARDNRPGLIEALRALADVCLRLEDWPGAIAAAEELVTLRAVNVEIWAELGDARLNIGLHGRRGGCVPSGRGVGAQGTDAAAQLRR